ncbi:MAG: sigma-54-dependent transcriptional regulator [Nitrospinaceae bacterium]
MRDELLGAWTILIVGGSPAEQEELRPCLEGDRRLCFAANADSAFKFIKGKAVDLVLCDQELNGHSVIELLKRLKEKFPGVIKILSGRVELEDLLRAVNEAAIHEYFSKPWQPAQFNRLIRKMRQDYKLANLVSPPHPDSPFTAATPAENQDDDSRRNGNGFELDKLIFSSAAMVQACEMAVQAPATDLPILIQGETGIGKELLARAIHSKSNRRRQPLLTQNCGGIPSELLQSELFGHKRGAFTGAVSDRLGLFPAADGGTVFLDEISEISMASQVALLRFLQEGEVKPVGKDTVEICDVRILAASGRPLKELVDRGKFREDLFFRLNGFEITLPPLRDRAEDIPVLMDFLAQKYAASIHKRVPGFSPDVVAKFKAYAWPGNVRELENEIRRMVAVGKEGELLTEKHLTPTLAKVRPHKNLDLMETPTQKLVLFGNSLKENVESLEAQLVSTTLERCQWNQTKAAKELGLSRVGLASKIKRYGLKNG